MKPAGKAYATEGVTLSGALLGEDCRWIELWRIPSYTYTVGCRRGKVQNAPISQAKGQSVFPTFKSGDYFAYFCLTDCAFARSVFFIFESSFLDKLSNALASVSSNSQNPRYTPLQ